MPPDGESAQLLSVSLAAAAKIAARQVVKAVLRRSFSIVLLRVVLLASAFSLVGLGTANAAIVSGAVSTSSSGSAIASAR